jgi:hypothetical protein
MKMGFGKYKNVQVDAVPRAYLDFISRQDWFQNVRARVRRAISDRLGLPFIPNESPYGKGLGDLTKRKAILDKSLERTISFDDFKDSKNNNSNS